MKRSATITADGLYRLDLTRAVQVGCSCDRCVVFKDRAPRPGFVLWALANPSTANESTDDNTERRGWGFTTAWGYGEMRFINVNPCRSTNPKLVHIPRDAVMLDNDEFLKYHAMQASLIVCAWGSLANDNLAQRAESVLRATAAYGSRLTVLALTKHGRPAHPLYLSSKLRPRIWEPNP